MMVVMYILGTSFLVAPGIEARQDIWLAYLLSLALSVILACVFARMMSHMPDKDFFAILESLLGRPLAVIFMVLMSIYLFQHYSYVLRHFSEYINVAGLPGTPVYFSLISMGLLSALAVYLGIGVLGKWSQWFLLIVAVFIVFAALLLTQNMKLDNLRPALENGFAPVAKGAFSLISFPFGQIVAFLFILPPMEKRRGPYRVFIIGLLLGGALLFISSIANVLVLGVKSVSRLYYPSYSTLAIIRMGNFIQRLEMIATTIFMVTVFLKATVLLMGLMRSLASIFRLDRYGFILIPVVLLGVNYGFNAYEGNLQHHTGIVEYVPYFTTFYQIIVPFVIFLLLEWRMALRKRQNRQYAAGLGKGGQ